MKTLTFLSPIGTIAISAEAGFITSLSWKDVKYDAKALSERVKNDDDSILLDKAKCQILEYFNGIKVSFELPLSPSPTGTEYQSKVWQALREIPFGQTVSYKDLAIKLNSAPRAIGQACRSNRIPILIPCHRVVSHDGSIGGFSGYTNSDSPEIKIKKTLIALEAAKM